MLDIPCFIIEELKKQKKSQKELANETGLFDQTVSAYTTGKSLPRLPYLEAIADALGFEVALVEKGAKIDGFYYK